MLCKIQKRFPETNEIKLKHTSVYMAILLMAKCGLRISEPLRIQKVEESEHEISDRVSQALEDLDLVPPEEFLYRFPHELSGGQRQRVAIARAFVLRPEFLVADEPVSMLDASIRSEVLKLLIGMQKKLRTAFLYITHDIALARHMCDRIAVMYLGKIVEVAKTENLFSKPLHPYTNALLSGIPIPDVEHKQRRMLLSGDVPSPVNPPEGCRFHTRCPFAVDRCQMEKPHLEMVEEAHQVACHRHRQTEQLVRDHFGG